MTTTNKIVRIIPTIVRTIPIMRISDKLLEAELVDAVVVLWKAVAGFQLTENDAVEFDTP